MITSGEKLKRGGNDIVQLVITRKCDLHTCSECTQLLPFRQDVQEMSLDCIEAALKIMADWPGVTACFGGNPVSHSKFPEVCALFEKYIPDQSRRGLWTNNLLRHGEIIKKTFWPHGRFNLNVHGNLKAAAEMDRWLPGILVFGKHPSHHGGMLLDYRDYGITEREWIGLREKCDINQNWSAGIYEREGKPHVYFCEVAGSIDGVRNVNNGLLLEPGWWNWPIERFNEQIKNCCDAGCGVPLRTKGSLDTVEVYGISPSWESKLPPMKGRVEVKIHKELPGGTHELTDYQHLRANE